MNSSSTTNCLSLNQALWDDSLLIDIVQNPDTARKVLHCQHELVLAQRKPEPFYQLLRNHQAGACKCGDAERFANRLPLRGVKVDSPYVEKSPTVRDEINRLAIG